MTTSTLTPIDTTTKKSTWSNKDNANYYEQVPVEVFRHYAIIGGFENGCDIDVVYDRIKDADSIIEVGAGYGRVLKSLLDRGYKGKLIGIERSANFCRYMHETLGTRAIIYHANAEDFVSPVLADVVMWMWSNISEWPKDQQCQMLKHVTQYCKPGGLIVLDTISHAITPLNANHYETQRYSAFTEYGNVEGYVPTVEEIDAYATNLNIKKVEHIPYVTSTNRERIIHLLFLR